MESPSPCSISSRWSFLTSSPNIPTANSNFAMSGLPSSAVEHFHILTLPDPVLIFRAPRANQLRILRLELEGLERPSVSHHHLNALEDSKMIVALHVRTCEGYRWIGPENDFGRHAAKRYQDSNIRRRRRRRQEAPPNS